MSRVYTRLDLNALIGGFLRTTADKIKHEPEPSPLQQYLPKVEEEQEDVTQKRKALMEVDNNVKKRKRPNIKLQF